MVFIDDSASEQLLGAAKLQPLLETDRLVRARLASGVAATTLAAELERALERLRQLDAEMTHLRRLKSLPISERIVRRPSASVTLSMDLRNEMLFNKVDAPSARPETPPPVAKLAKNRRGSMDSNEGSVGRVKRAMEDVERSRGKMDARVEVAAK